MLQYGKKSQRVTRRQNKNRHDFIESLWLAGKSDKEIFYTTPAPNEILGTLTSITKTTKNIGRELIEKRPYWVERAAISQIRAVHRLEKSLTHFEKLRSFINPDSTQQLIYLETQIINLVKLIHTIDSDVDPADRVKIMMESKDNQNFTQSAENLTSVGK